jgi:tRNA pseudouridine55 synthase
VTCQVLSESAVDKTASEIQNEALSLYGDFQLPIPLYSAKKVDGKKLYEYAREGAAIEQPTKLMSFWSVEPREAFKFHLHCSKGSFIRSWVQLLGEKLGCGASMASLRRTESHSFNLSEALALSQVENMTAEEIGNKMIPLDQALKGVKSIRVKGQDAVLMKNGQISHPLRSQLIARFNPESDQIIQILPEKKGDLLALVGLEKGQGFKIKRVFNC